MKLECTDDYIKELLMDIASTYKKKNAAYGDSAHGTYMKYGEASYATRISDKLRRYENLINNPHINDLGESICDTLKDAICYCFMLCGSVAADKIGLGAYSSVAYCLTYSLMMYMADHCDILRETMDDMGDYLRETDMRDYFDEWYNRGDLYQIFLLIACLIVRYIEA